jgi:hypothetical protein
MSAETRNQTAVKKAQNALLLEKAKKEFAHEKSLLESRILRLDLSIEVLNQRGSYETKQKKIQNIFTIGKEEEKLINDKFINEIQ